MDMFSAETGRGQNAIPQRVMTIRGVIFRIKSAPYRLFWLPLQLIFSRKFRIFFVPVQMDQPRLPVSRICPNWRQGRQLLEPRDKLNHSLTHFCVRQQTADAGLHIVLEMARIIGRWDHASHRRVRDDPFQKELRPRSTVEFGRPVRQLFGPHMLKQTAPPNGRLMMTAMRSSWASGRM